MKILFQAGIKLRVSSLWKKRFLIPSSSISKFLCVIGIFLVPVTGLSQSNVVITGFSPNGLLTCSNLLQNSTCRVEWASALAGPWTNSWAGLTDIAVGTNKQIAVLVPMFYRVVMTLPPPPNTNIYTIGFCKFGFPLSISTGTNQSTSVYGWVYIFGLTDLSPMNNPAPNVVAQVGFGPVNSAPANNTNWTWVTAVSNPSFVGSGGQGNLDEYVTSLTIPGVGSYHGVFRFSGNAGATWLYAGKSDSGPTDGSAPLANAVPITITP